VKLGFDGTIAAGAVFATTGYRQLCGFRRQSTEMVTERSTFFSPLITYSYGKDQLNQLGKTTAQLLDWLSWVQYSTFSFQMFIGVDSSTWIRR
jgi:hypothetical protein